ncbi:MAG: nuclear transport factor 2 family protein [Candidatus Diapherotrites archaeon]|nr:nuclear transport factor 2 family protein [Candidatus Diapherotrites archaeon]
MNARQVKQVMELYGKAWEQRDSKLILDCFIKNAVYQESPLAAPLQGHKKIKAFWERVVAKNTKSIQFRLKKAYISLDGKTGFAEWECKSTHKWAHDQKWRKGRMAGIMILKMKGNKISYLNEYWRTKTTA